MAAVEFSNPVVIDNGSGMIKAGFAGEENPKIIFPALVGRTKYERVMTSEGGGQISPDEKFFVGNKAQELRGILRLSYPTRHGITTDWKDMQAIWQYTYDQLNLRQDEHPVLLTEAPLNPRSNRAKFAEIFFELFHVPAFYVQTQAILSLYASGRTTGVVLDSGDGATHSVAVYEGFAIPHAITRIDVAGRDVTEYLHRLLRKAGINFHTSAEMEVVKTIKEKLCHVAYNIEKLENDASADVEPEAPFKLPDGQVISIGPEKFRAPEVLFNPSLIGLEYMGIHQCLFNTIQLSDLDIRRRLYGEIVLAGGSTMFHGFGDRLLSELKKLAPRETKIRIYAPPQRLLSAWIGGSILASLATFKRMWVTRKEYDDMGKSVIFRKTF